jgi:transposase-like protein/IS1 family transposase
VTCHNCGTADFKRFGRTRQGWQRHRCRKCGKTHCEAPERPLDTLRVDLDKAAQVVHLLAEGVGIRAISRLTGLHQQTVLNVLEFAGEKCARLLDTLIRDVPCESVQIDELWAFVYCKQVNSGGHPERGDAYTFLAIDRKSKLILSHLTAKRHYENGLAFIQDLKTRVAGRFQLTSDQWQGYVRAVLDTFYGGIDFAQQQKDFAPLYTGSSNFTARRYSPGMCTGVNTMIHIGNPVRELISTSHVERTNLSVRLFNRRFTRLTLGYSKTVTNLRHSVALLIAHFNFCRVHSAHRQTPAQAAGITEKVWTCKDLLCWKGERALAA